jgi:glycosyltransferase involved in cell wall biosynthesis
MNPLISIIIPSYNHAHFLARALESVMSQTYANWEVIIVDNHSEDNTDQVISNFNDSRISLLKIHNEGIIARSRNKGVLASRGEWIAFLDSDDWWKAEKLSACVVLMDQPYDLIFHDLKIERPKTKLIAGKYRLGRTLTKPITTDLLINGNPISTTSVLVRKDMLMKVELMDESAGLVAAEDFNCWLKIAEKNGNFVHLPQVLGYYFIHSQGMSKRDISESVRNASESFSKNLSPEQYKRYQSHIVFASARYAFLNKQFNDTIPKLKYCFKYGTFQVKMSSLYMFLIALTK